MRKVQKSGDGDAMDTEGESGESLADGGSVLRVMRPCRLSAKRELHASRHGLSLRV